MMRPRQTDIVSWSQQLQASTATDLTVAMDRADTALAYGTNAGYQLRGDRTLRHIATSFAPVMTYCGQSREYGAGTYAVNRTTWDDGTFCIELVCLDSLTGDPTLATGKPIAQLFPGCNVPCDIRIPSGTILAAIVRIRRPAVASNGVASGTTWALAGITLVLESD